MKKIFLLLIPILMLLTSCGYKGYSNNNLELYSTAVNSVLWINGYSWSADFECDPQIEIIDKDEYGRVLYTYYEKYYKGSNLSFSSLIVCQNSNEKEVYYYEDINYIVKKQTIYSKNIEKFSEEEISYLKSINDWNKEIDYGKCVRKDKIKRKQKIINKKEIQNKLIDKFKLTNTEYVLYFDYLTSNNDDSKYIIYGFLNKKEEDNLFFVSMIEKNNDVKLNLFFPSNIYDYKEELINFKKMNNWY